jgi:hypothetical protein
MRRHVFLWGFLLGLALAAAAVMGYWTISAHLKLAGSRGIAPETVADYLHAVIEANRVIYTKNVVDKMQEHGIVEAAEHWKQQNTLPLPAQFLMDTGRLVAEKGSGIRYRLVSLSPIYVWNKPSTDFERQGLEVVTKNPSRPHTGFVRIGRDRFFQAVYPDLAVSQSCVNCHNQHINSPKKDYKLGDVMGGIVITIPAPEQ